MLGFAALILAAASANTTPALTTSSWWEKVTYTISGDGVQQACQYESSFSAGGTASCDYEYASSPISRAGSGSAGTYTKITIERRFTPGDRPDAGKLELGDTLLGGQIMSLAIDGSGQVRSCKVVVASGEVRPVYGCNEARAERFEASAGREASRVQQGFMTILVYGHEGQLV